MAAWYTRSKLGFNTIKAASSSPLRSKITNNNNYYYPIAASHFRYYHVDRPQKRPPTLIAALTLLLVSGIGGILYFTNLEKIPYMKRKRFIPLSVHSERLLGRSMFLEKKAEFEGRIVPEMDPDSVRVQMILKHVLQALETGFKKEALTYVASRSNGVQLGSLRFKMILNLDASKPVNRELVPFSHLEGLNWEVLVVKDDAAYACCLPGGKIIVFTGLLERFSTDEELATVIANEVAHVVERHYATWFTRSLYRAPVFIVLYKLLSRERVNKSRLFQQEIRFCQRIAIEADYIGLLLMASAGYDPRVAPKVFEKMVQAWRDSASKNYASTHPWGKTNTKVACEARVMQKAISMYEEAIAS